MDDKNRAKTLPINIIIASFRGELTESQRVDLDQWLQLEGSVEKYEALKKVWVNTVANSSVFDSQKAYGRLRRKVSNIWKPIAVAASVAAVAAFGFVLFNVFDTNPVLTQTYACVTGKSSVILPDGSNVVLHKGASLSYDNSFSETTRAVTLDGEAYFAVAKDAENTFTVHVDDIDITVHGTTFNVQEDGESVVVSLVEGAVDSIALDIGLGIGGGVAGNHIAVIFSTLGKAVAAGVALGIGAGAIHLDPFPDTQFVLVVGAAADIASQIAHDFIFLSHH